MQIWAETGKLALPIRTYSQILYQFLAFTQNLKLSRIRTNNTIERLNREIKRLKDNWDAISPIFKLSATVRRVIYTTNALELLNSTCRKLNRQRSVFPSDTALLKVLYLTTFEATKRWTSTIRNRAQIHCELGIMYEGRLPE